MHGYNDTLIEKFQISSSKETVPSPIVQVGNVAYAGAFAKIDTLLVQPYNIYDIKIAFLDSNDYWYTSCKIPNIKNITPWRVPKRAYFLTLRKNESIEQSPTF